LTYHCVVRFRPAPLTCWSKAGSSRSCLWPNW